MEMQLQPTLSALIVVGIELVTVALLCGLLHQILVLTVLRPALAGHAKWSAWSTLAQLKLRNLILALCFVAVCGVLIYNGWLLARGIDSWQHTRTLLQSITIESWIRAGTTLGKIVLALIAAWIVTRVLRRVTGATERAINRWDQLRDNNKSLAALFAGLDRAIANVGWMLVAIFTCGLVSAPQPVTDAFILLLRLYVVFSVGLTVVRSTSVIVDTIDGISRRYAERRGWLGVYDHLRPLLPTFRACLEYTLWIGLGSLSVAQLPPIRDLAVWGPRLIQAIAIFFASRVVIELGNLELSRRVLPGEGVDETERRRRATMVPLVRTGFTYGVYFGAAVLMLNSLGFNPMPFLAGAGILGLVIGFGAQSLINDIVSGFFILFENTCLVGETVEVGTPDLGTAKGVIEAIEFRTTKIRDESGRLHVFRNGDMKPIINYSRDYAVAVVDLTVTYDADLQAVFTGLRQAAERVRATHPDVLAETEIEGVVAFAATTLTVRTMTRVRAGRNDSVSAALRFAIKEVFDRQANGVVRRTLIPRAMGGAARPMTAVES